MADQAIHEMISAFAAGCMDEENYSQFKKYIKSGGDLPEGELGELQNVISLVPAILDLEQPAPEIKEKVAKKLISLQDEIKKRIKERKEKPTQEFTGIKEKKPTVEKTAVKNDPFATELHNQRFTQVEPRRTSTSADESKAKRTDEARETLKAKPKPLGFQTQTQIPKTQPLSTGTQAINSKLLTGMYIGMGSLIIILIVFIFYFFKATGDLETKVETLTTQDNELRNQLTVANKFITDYSDFVNFFNYQDVKVVNLSGTELSPASSGKLFISFEAREGLLRLNDLPSLSPEQAYQLWLVSRGQSYSLGLFIPKPGDKYIKIQSIPYVPENDVDLVRITNESKAGADLPQGNTFLYGVFPGSNPQQQRRR